MLSRWTRDISGIEPRYTERCRDHVYSVAPVSPAGMAFLSPRSEIDTAARNSQEGVRMGSGYYEHEIEVRYAEGILAKSRDWQWFLDETNKTFGAPKLENECFVGFRMAFQEIAPAYRHLGSIADIGHALSLSFPSEWIRRVWGSCLVRSGALDLPDKPTGDVFFDLLDVVSYSTRLLNSVSDRNLAFDFGLFCLGNYQDLFELHDLADEGDKIANRLSEISKTGLDENIRVVRGNFEGKVVDCDEDAVANFLDKEFDADFLHFAIPDGVVCKTWQEAYLLDCLRTSYQGDELIPFIGFRNGGSIPDFSLLTDSILANMRRSIKDARAHCVIDSIGYLLHGLKIPEESMGILIDLALGRIEDVSLGMKKLHELNCTSVGLCARMAARKDLSKTDKSNLFGGFSRITESVENLDFLAAIERMGFPLSKQQKRLLDDAKREKCLVIDSITDQRELLQYLEDKDISWFCSQTCAEKAMRKFDALVNGAEADVVLLFVAAMNFLIRLLNNKNIDNRWVKSLLIATQTSWNETFHERSVAGMHAITQEFSISTEQSNGLNAEILKNPLLFGYSAFPLGEDVIESRIEGIAQYPIGAMIQTITIDKYIPHKSQFDRGSDSAKHSVDAMILGEISRINEKYSYRHLNQLKAEELAAQLCREAIQKTLILTNVIQVIPGMYDSIRKRVSDRYVLIDYPGEGEMPTLAHACQLFPVMESTIRELGIHFNCTPFRAREDEFHILRDAPQVLGELIGDVHDETGTIAGTDDLTFVYFAMFSKNGFNIRNACVHGQGYQRGAQLTEAFKLTVICEYMLLYRLDMVIRAEEEMVAPKEG